MCTDKIICNFQEPNALLFELDENYNSKGLYFNGDITVLNYKFEYKNERLRFPKMGNFRKRENYGCEKKPYNIYQDVPVKKFTPSVYTILDTNKSFSVLGPAGTGNCTGNLYLRKQIQAELTNQHKQLVWHQLIKQVLL